MGGLSDFAQVGTLISRLQDLKEVLTDPWSVVEKARELYSMVEHPPPGDPVALRDLASAFRVEGGVAQSVAEEADDLGRLTLPDVWLGASGLATSIVLDANARVIEQTRPAFDTVANALDDNADEVEALQSEHSDLRQRLREDLDEVPVEVGAHVSVFGVEIGGSITLPNPVELVEFGITAVRLVDDFITLYSRGVTAATTLNGVLLDAAGRATAGAARSAGMSPASAVVAGDPALAGPTDVGGLPPAMWERAMAEYAALSAADRQVVDFLLAGLSPLGRMYLLKALAAGHTADELAAFASLVAGRSDDWMREHLGMGASANGFEVAGRPVEQSSQVTCGPTSLIVARALADPVYALWLTTGNQPDTVAASGDAFAQRFAEEQERVHDGTAWMWPQSLGVHPYGMETGMSAHSPSDYDVAWVDDTNDFNANPSLRDTVAAVNRGEPVPILVTDTLGGTVSEGTPMHYKVVVGSDGTDLLVYNPANGDLERIPEDAFRDGEMDDGGRQDHVQAVIVPGA